MNITIPLPHLYAFMVVTQCRLEELRDNFADEVSDLDLEEDRKGFVEDCVALQETFNAYLPKMKEMYIGFRSVDLFDLDFGLDGIIFRS